MALYKRSRFRDTGFRRVVPLVLLVVITVLVIIFMIRDGVDVESWSLSQEVGGGDHVELDTNFRPELPEKTDLATSLEKRNRLPPRNRDRFPNLARDHIKIVLYVHNRPQYLELVIRSLLNVEGIGETLLVVSHDGYFEEMDRIVQGIEFCQVKQIFAPYSPHLYPDSFLASRPEIAGVRMTRTRRSAGATPTSTATTALRGSCP
ncbi:alpha-1,6-mannosyl-glycoprotein 2-beta-N-acetylglucosaminyltransferase [Iris pallida]|uniref:Alpha-1,6-mannosyl-glycoprotein 2-beta-N-acetylglucosaminyltransferase n=1 Tax=Iris pallida TaxID=29817 RepID=A0AAX6HV73_IRIPA|nr:alpha-1,6-mannosyl-glycoprotein 2-beta-N-acetylglucosaminyltransferase [Iris pallida]